MAIKTNHQKIKLPDFWWVFRRHHFGRSGHRYTCPALMTLSIWVNRLQGRQSYWVASLPGWLEKDGDNYSPASAVIDLPQGGAKEVRLCLPEFFVEIEMWLSKKWLLWGFPLRQPFDPES